MKFLGNPLQIPAAAAGDQAVRRSYVDAIGSRVAVLEAGSGGEGGPATSWVTVAVTADHSAVPRQFVLADALDGEITVTLPDSPAADSVIGVKKVDTGGNPVRVVPSGTATVDGDPDAEIGVGGVAATFIFDGNDWAITSTVSFETATTFTYRGTWDPDTAYFADDVVFHDGGSFVALDASTGTTPVYGTHTATWAQMAARGAQGEQGEQGLPGEQGEPGLPGPAGGVLTVTPVQTSTYTAAANELVLADASAAAFTVNLPAGAATGTRIAVKKVDSTNRAVTVVPATGHIDGSPNYQLNVLTNTVTVQFDGAAWRIESSSDTKTGLVPAGGSAGQALRKTSSSVDYATGWSWSSVPSFVSVTDRNVNIPAPANGMLAHTDATGIMQYANGFWVPLPGTEVATLQSSSSQNIAHSTSTFTPVTLSTNVYLPFGQTRTLYDRYVLPFPGRYRIKGSVTFSTNVNGLRAASLDHTTGGSSISLPGSYAAWPAGWNGYVKFDLEGTCTATTTNDYVRMLVRQESGATLALGHPPGHSMTVTYLGPAFTG